jgi:hypothetical protein
LGKKKARGVKGGLHPAPSKRGAFTLDSARAKIGTATLELAIVAECAEPLCGLSSSSPRAREDSTQPTTPSFSSSGINAIGAYPSRSSKSGRFAILVPN